MNVLLVEDQRLVADAMRMMLQDIDPSLEITSCYSTQHALSVIDQGQKKFDLVLTDLLMPGIDGLGLLAGICNRHSRTPVVVISGHDEDRYIRAAIEHGAAGFIPKSLPGSEVVAAMRQIIAGERFFPERFAMTEARAVGRDVPETTPPVEDSLPRPGRKQLQVLQLMADGNSNKQISQIVGITEATVKYHTSQLFRLFGVRNRTSCVREAQQRGLIRSFEEH